MGSIVGFPNPVNETSARVVAGGVVTMTVATIVLDQPWIMVPLTYGFAARVLTGPKLSPLGQLATRVVTPRLEGPYRLVPGPPKRLAQGVGLAFCAGALALYYGAGRKRGAYALLGALTAAASAEAFVGFCVACRAFPYLVKAGLVSEESCQECNDIWRRSDGTV